MPTGADLLGEFEVHSPDGIRKLLAAGVSPTDPIEGKRPIDCLIEMYLRSPRFTECLQVMLEAGATVGGPFLEALLLDNDSALRTLLDGSREGLQRKLSPLCAFTSCRGVSALHICAEFNSTRCAQALLEAGADVNARADRDVDGLGGHTPIFHAVNSIFNYCRPMMEILVGAGADLDVRVPALLWGESMGRWIGKQSFTMSLPFPTLNAASTGNFTAAKRMFTVTSSIFFASVTEPNRRFATCPISTSTVSSGVFSYEFRSERI